MPNTPYTKNFIEFKMIIDNYNDKNSLNLQETPYMEHMLQEKQHNKRNEKRMRKYK